MTLQLKKKKGCIISYMNIALSVIIVAAEWKIETLYCMQKVLIYRPLISVQFKIPEDSFFFEDPTIARWDDQKLVWRQDGFQDTTFVEGTDSVRALNLSTLLAYV